MCCGMDAARIALLCMLVCLVSLPAGKAGGTAAGSASSGAAGGAAARGAAVSVSATAGAAAARGGGGSAPGDGGSRGSGGGGGQQSGGGGAGKGAQKSSSGPPSSSKSSSGSSGPPSSNAAPAAPKARSAPAAQGVGATSAPARSRYVPASYRGPVMTSASGAVVPHNCLTMGYPVRGVAYGVPVRPAQSATRTAYPNGRPFHHTYPAGYSLVFIPYYSPVYTGSHWGVYDQNQNFYGYDDGDVSGEYDYDEGDGLPQGCEYADQQVAASTGALSLTDQSSAAAPAEAPLPGPAPAQVAGRRALLQAAAVPPPLSAAGPPLAAAGPPLLAPGPTAGAPGPARAPGDAAAVAPESAAAPQDSAGLVQMLCKPVPAQQNVQGSGWHGTGLSNQQVKAIAITAAVVFLIFCCCLGGSRR